jgi:hypothetical protein
VKELRTCGVANPGCRAPAGYGTREGWFPGTKSARATCFQCGEPVCGNSKCSSRVKYLGKRRRICADCLEMLRR